MMIVHDLSKRRRFRVTVLLIAALAILLSGCAAPWPFPQPTPDPKLPDAQQIMQPQQIGPNNGEVYTLDPALTSFTEDVQLAQLLFPGLVTLDEDQRVTDWAAERHEISTDGLTYTFRLHRGMQWSDGTPITAETFAYAINRTLDPCIGSDVATNLYPIKGARAFHAAPCPVGELHSPATLIGASLLAPDPATLQIHLEQPAAYFLAALASSASWAVPQSLVERYTQPAVAQPYYPYAAYTASTWTEHLTDSGGLGGNLYRLTKWDHAGHLEFERNERFWGPKPALWRIVYTLYKSTTPSAPSSDLAWADYLAGKGDTSQPPQTQLDLAKRLTGTTLVQTPQLGVVFLAPNWQRAPFDDARIRQALFLVIDRERLAHEVYADTVIPSIHLTPQGLPGYNAALVDPAGRRGTDALMPNREAARAPASAYAAEKCRGDDAKCAPIVLHSGYRDANALMAQMIQANWREVFPQWPFYLDDGCRLQICPPSIYQLTTRGWLADYPDEQDFLTLLWSTHGPHNYSNVSIPAADALCAQADMLGDQAGRVARYQQAEQLLVMQSAAIPLYQDVAVYAVRSRVADWRLGASGLTPLSAWQRTYIRR